MSEDLTLDQLLVMQDIVTTLGGTPLSETHLGALHEIKDIIDALLTLNGGGLHVSDGVTALSGISTLRCPAGSVEEGISNVVALLYYAGTPSDNTFTGSNEFDK